MSSSDSAVPSASIQSAEDSGQEQKPEQPHGSRSNSSTGTETQAKHTRVEPSGQRDLTAFPPLFDEIRQLQERILYLEDQAARQWKAAAEDTAPGEVDTHESYEDPDSDDDVELRKHIRRAPSGRRRLEEIERHAEERADERKDHGQGPNNSEWTKAKSTMHHIQPSGEMMPGDEFNAIFGDRGWYDTHGLPFPGSVRSLDQDLHHRQLDKPFPHRGVRPSTALHPFYKKPLRDIVKRKHGEVPPLRLSRKLGPPTKWDGSDAEEWSSDTSTRSQDFKYFRARLRGDFEWELDRLNAQVLRYRKHQKKKKSHQLAIKTQRNDQRSHEEFGIDEEQSAFMQRLKLDAELAGNDKHGIRRFRSLEWSAFRFSRALPLQHSYVIDVLIEEPKLSSDVRPWRRGKTEKKENKNKGNEIDLRTTPADDTGSKDDTGSISKQPGPWTIQEPLPERIRINSKQIIDILSSIHGTSLCRDENETSSVVILRPFRILKAYDKEIRERCSKLEDNAATQSVTSRAVREENQKQDIQPDTVPEDGYVERPSEATEEFSGVGKEGKVNSQEGHRLQLEHFSCLQKFMDDYIVRRDAYLNSTSCRKIFFSDFWHLFQPGTTVISADGKQAYRVVSLRSKRHRGVDRWAAFWARKKEKASGKPDSSDEATDDTRPDITMKCVFIHFNGTSFGPVIQTFVFHKWDGEKEVTYLDVYPVRFHVLKQLDQRSLSSTSETPTALRESDVEEGMQALRQKLIDRGKVFLNVAAMKQMYYSGLAIDTRDEIESQVMVDFSEALAHETRQSWIPKVTTLVGTDWNPKTDEADEGCTAECCWQENVHDDSYVETNNTDKFIDDMMAEIKDTRQKLPSAIIFPRSLEETKTDVNALSDDELMILSHSVFGFVLRDRTWAKLDLDCMSAVRSPGDATEQTDDDFEEGGQGAFGQLVLPPGYKKMVLSLISQHFRNKGSQESNDKQTDIVRGKGKGLIILLHGAPGVGKTTTAEGVAETFGQPLFQITCGDLGSNPKDVEAALQTNFALANRWGCILLLDEADVFLAERRREDFNRNGLVAVFLRVLEYYAGILFLTTNRIGDFDEAFASRIHMSLHYPALDEVSTAKVFRLNLGLIKTRLQDRIKIEEDEIITAAGKHWREHKEARWNGRQIRNACQTALALAEFDAQPKGKKYDIKEKSTAKIHLKLSHLEIVSNAYLEFTDYLKAVHGADAEGRAKESGLRTVETILEAIRSDRKEGSARDHRSHSRGRGQTGRETPFQGFRLRSGSSGQHATFSPEPGTHHTSAHPGMYSPQRLAHEQPSGPAAQRMQYNQSAYAGNQSFMGGMRGGAHPSSQNVHPGSYLQAPQSSQGYGGAGGRGGHGHYQTSDPYVQDDQPLQGHGVSYPSPAPSAASGGPAGGSASLGHFGDDQGRQGHGGGPVPYDESQQM